MESSVRPLAGASLHIVGQEGVILDAARQRIYSADPLAILVWCRLEEGAGIREIVRSLIQDHAVSGREALRSVVRIISAWKKAGLVGRCCDTDLAEAQAGTEPDEAAGHSSAFGNRSKWSHRPARWAAEEIYRVLGTDVRLCFASWAHAEVARAAFGHLRPAAAGEAAVTLDIVAEHHGLAAFESCRRIDGCDNLDQLVPMLKWMLLDVALARSADFCALHAAAVSADGLALALLGPSGSGKSTLAAALVGQGFEYVADDTLVLEESELRARVLNLGFCLKQGSWEALAPYCRDLARRRIHIRQDGKVVRYVPPPAESTVRRDGHSVPIRVILFPRYTPGEGTVLRPVTKAEAVRRILPQCHPLRMGFDRQRLDRLIGWIEARDRFDLAFSDLAEAGAALRSVSQP